ncbi:CRISPR-associated exonuclease Cas4 (modular protein) [Kyrpidia spormannii]|uniref:CRISPR-associated exonuclease Cas4 n=1 Tax=Kyrpidia spormannii TaxID=2055160 RepID=A0A6F9EG78_9BACL|nr:CRISPR-associated exonuclease Cas4 (modular protein) [Kyrpidia spormannii]
MEDEIRINGTLVWYYAYCPREAWLMSRQMTPDEDDENVVIGRFLHENRQPRGRKEVEVAHSKLDVVRRESGTLVVTEVKKSGRSLKGARMQVLFYLRELKNRGIEAEGELVVPEERRVERVVLTEEDRAKIEETVEELRALLRRETPPPAKRIPACKRCATGNIAGREVRGRDVGEKRIPVFRRAIATKGQHVSVREPGRNEVPSCGEYSRDLFVRRGGPDQKSFGILLPERDPPSHF